MEQRLYELGVENARLRNMVGWPLDDRPPLGRGPTGNDKPKSFDNLVDFFSNHESNLSAEESSSTCTSSLSPSPMVRTSSPPTQVSSNGGADHAEEVRSLEPLHDIDSLSSSNSRCLASTAEHSYSTTSKQLPGVNDSQKHFRGDGGHEMQEYSPWSYYLYTERPYHSIRKPNSPSPPHRPTNPIPSHSHFKSVNLLHYSGSPQRYNIG